MYLVESGAYLEDLFFGLQQTLLAIYGLTTGPSRCKLELHPKTLTQSSEKSLQMRFWFLLFKTEKNEIECMDDIINKHLLRTQTALIRIHLNLRITMLSAVTLLISM